MLLYIHVPFCIGKCDYCAFFSEKYVSGEVEQYVCRVVREMEIKSRQITHPVVTSVYIGGGTPSLLASSQFAMIFEAVHRCFALSKDVEITVEANPESVLRPGLLSELLTMGVSRISLGVQSFQEKFLRILGRPHTVQDAENAVTAVHEAGFTNVSADLIWGLPDQTEELWLEDLDRAATLGPTHLSCYGLSLEAGTALNARICGGEVAVPGEDECAAMYLRGSDFLESCGYAQYEISNYARPGYASRHNIGYWESDEYLGLGPSAVSTIGARRWTNPANLTEYALYVAAGCPERDLECLSAFTREQEMVMLSLRMSKGLDLKRFKALTGHDFLQCTRSSVERLCSSDLARLRFGHLQLTRKGMLLSNSIIGMLLDLMTDMPEHMENT